MPNGAASKGWASCFSRRRARSKPSAQLFPTLAGPEFRIPYGLSERSPAKRRVHGLDRERLYTTRRGVQPCSEMHFDGVALDLVIPPFDHPDEVEKLGDLLLVDAPKHPRELAEVIATRKESIEPWLLESGTEEARRARVVGPAIVAAYLRRAAVPVKEAEQDPDGRRLSGAVGTEKSEDFALVDAE